jgi:hypothetical protein
LAPECFKLSLSYYIGHTTDELLTEPPPLELPDSPETGAVAATAVT